MNEVGLADSPFLTTHVHSGPRANAVTNAVLSRCSDTCVFLRTGKAPVMPIRRAAATPSQEKAPSSATEKG